MKNPIFKGYFADPDAAIFNGKLYVYPTTDGVGWVKATEFRAFSSEDFVNFKDEGVILDLHDVKWTRPRRAWAPTICYRNGKYYFYFTANFQIGVAVSDSPTGPFVATNKPIVRVGKNKFITIDPHVFIDDDGTAYLYWGNSVLHVARLNRDMTELAEKPKVITPAAPYNEGTHVFKRNGIYYFTYSCGDTCSPDYHIRCATSDSPTKTPTGSRVILHRDFADDKRIKCTGHHTILNVPGTDEWYILYHRFEIEQYGNVEEFSEDAGSHREVCMDRLYFDDDGNIIPVKPTND